MITKDVLELITYKSDKIAIKDEKRSLSYKELDELSDLFCIKLRRLGVKDNDLIGVRLFSSCELSIVILGILKCGAGYVPIDVNYPIERAKYILKDAECKLLISQKEDILKNLDVEFKITNIPFSIKELLTYINEEPYKTSYNPDNIAYVIYTSGSTGHPKGVVIKRKHLTNFLYSISKKIKVNQNDILFSLTPVSFDIFGLEFYLTLISQAQVIICPNHLRTDIDYISQQLSSNQITIFQSTPSTLRMLINSNETFYNLKKVLCGGEYWDASLANQIFSIINDNCELWNMYGPTEATIWSSCSLVGKGEKEIYLGDPLENYFYFILNENLHTTIEGELFIGGSSVADSYWKNENLTTKSFINHPLYGRLYKTGDIVRRVDKGLIYVGRNDSLIKLRGYRIEIGEIEKIINLHDKVEVSIVLPLKLNEEDHLHAVIIKKESTLNESEIKEHISMYLPSYMCPTYYHFCSSIPISLNGKIDRKNIKEMLENKSLTLSEKDRNSIVENQDNITNKLKTIWEDLLKVKQIDDSSNFFHLGGHSLMAARLLSKIRKEIACSLTMREILENITFGNLNKIIKKKIGISYQISNLSTFSENLIPVTFAQLTNFKEVSEGGGLALKLPSSWNIKGLLDIELLKKAFKYVINRHDSLRSSFIHLQNELKQSIHSNVEFDIIIHDISQLNDSLKYKEIENYIIENENLIIDLTKPPLFNVSIIKSSPLEHILLINFHHIIVDGWSKSIILDEVCNFYKNQTHKNSKEVVQFKEFVQWENKFIHSDEGRAQLKYWKEILSNNDILILKEDIDERKDYRGDIKYFKLENSIIIENINNICKSYNLTIFTFFTAIFVMVIYKRNTDNQNIIISTNVANRVTEEFETTVGLLMNTLLIPIEINNELGFTEHLEQVKNNVIDSLNNQNIPFEYILEELEKEYLMKYKHLGMVQLNFRNNLTSDINLGNEIQSFKMQRHPKTSILYFIMDIWTTQNSIEGAIEFSTELYSKEFIESFIDDFKLLVKNVSDNPFIKIKDIIYNEENRYAI
ncbi:MAG: amino acid adenylation domain-containing protein [Sphingobacteriia bacterium]|nr:amino acid adenylation domain-containing protein [Sphingobacteriia bacterium]